MTFARLLSRTTEKSFRAIAHDGASRYVAVGDGGLVFTGDGFDDTSVAVPGIAFEQVTDVPEVDFLAVAGSGSYFFAAGSLGTLLRSVEGTVWEDISSAVGTTGDLRGVAVDASSRVVVVGEGGIWVSTDDGSTFTLAAGAEILAVAGNGSDRMVAIGLNGYLATSSAPYTSWSAVESNVTGDLYDVALVQGAGAQAAVAVGADGILTETADLATWTSRTSGSSEDLNGVCTDGSGAWMAVGNGGVTYTSSDRSTWARQEGDQDWTIDLEDVVYADGRYTVVGSGLQVGYSLTGAVAPNFELFHPLSDEYRANDCAVAQGSVHLVGVTEYDSDENEWVYKPRRLRWTATGTFQDFSGVGSGFVDLPGGGQLLQGAVIAGNSIILGESDQISVVVPGAYSTWEYRPLASGLWAVSNFQELNNEVFFVASDGLLYRGSTTGVRRVESGFDLNQYDDFNAETNGACWIRYDANLQQLIIMQFSSPYILHMVEPDGGSYTTTSLRSISIDGSLWVPKSIATYSVPDEQAIILGYAPVVAGDDNGATGLVAIKAELSEPITGQDDFVSGTGDERRWWAEIQTGLIRVADVGRTVLVRDIEVRTWCEPVSSVVPPDVIIQVRSTAEESWRSLVPDAAGTITVDTTTTATATGSAFSRKVYVGDDTQPVVTTPCPAVKARLKTSPDGTTFTALTAGTDWTVTDTHEVTLGTTITTGTDLYCYWSGRPRLLSPAGDYVETSADFHRITAAPLATTLTIDAGVESGSEGDATYHPALQMQSGESVLTFGINQEVEELQVRIVVLPRDSANSPTAAKIRSIVLLLGDVSEELRDQDDK